jgi:hypothetical protein
MPLGSPHPAAADRSKAVCAPREDQREPASPVVSSEQEPSWLGVVGLDNAPGEQRGRRRGQVLLADPEVKRLYLGG